MSLERSALKTRGGRKSSEDVLVRFLQRLIHDVHLLVGSSSKEAVADATTLERRFRCEGFGFFSLVLPSLGRALDRGLESGTLTLPRGFRAARGAKTPVFLRGIFSCIFSEDGNLRSPRLSDVGVRAVAGLRQILYASYKTEHEYSRQRILAFLEGFCATDSDLPDELAFDSVLLTASQLLEELLADFNPYDMVPRHGPGAVATGEWGWEKYRFSRWYPQLHRLFPLQEYFGMTREEAVSLMENTEVGGDNSPKARVALVPKDSRGPRLISLEPLEVQFIQQGVMRELVPYIENHPLTEGVVNFTDQSINQELALRSSVTREFATVDLKDASDRVSLALVRALFPEHVLAVLEATRSTSTVLPDGREVRMKKYAPMGSALCFPVEALCFWALGSAVLHETNPGKKILTDRVKVYGDDLIIPQGTLCLITEAFERYGLRVNTDKSLEKGYFRESCGVDALQGENITPVKNRRKFWGARIDSTVLDQVAALMNHLSERGFNSAVELLWEEFPLPLGVATSGYPCLIVPNADWAEAYNRITLGRRKVRWNRALQRWEFKVMVTKAVSRDSQVWPEARLLHALLQGETTLAPNSWSERSLGREHVWGSYLPRGRPAAGASSLLPVHKRVHSVWQWSPV